MVPLQSLRCSQRGVIRHKSLIPLIPQLLIDYGRRKFEISCVLWQLAQIVPVLAVTLSLHYKFTLLDVQCQDNASGSENYFAEEQKVLVEGLCDEQHLFQMNEYLIGPVRFYKLADAWFEIYFRAQKAWLRNDEAVALKFWRRFYSEPSHRVEFL